MCNISNNNTDQVNHGILILDVCLLIFFLQVRGQCLQQDSVNSTHDRHKVHAFIYDFHPFTAALLKKKLGRQFSFLCIIHGLYVIKSSIQGNLTITSEANKNSVF